MRSTAHAELILDDTVRALDDDGDRVRVDFENGPCRDFDLVVGADGLHSQVRRLAFGPDEQFERYLNMVVAAFDVAGYRPRDELVAMMHAEVGFQAVRVSLRDDVTMVISHGPTRRRGAPGQIGRPAGAAAERLAGAGWETPAILELDAAGETFYFDAVSQIQMPSWTRGRVALVGMRRHVPRCWPARVRRWPWSSPTCWPRSWRAPTVTMRGHSPATRRGSPVPAVQAGRRQGLGAGVRAAERLQLLVRNTVMRLMGLPKWRIWRWAGASTTPSSYRLRRRLSRRRLHGPTSFAKLPPAQQQAILAPRWRSSPPTVSTTPR